MMFAGIMPASAIRPRPGTNPAASSPRSSGILVSCTRASGAASSVTTPSGSKLHALAYNLGNFMRTLVLPDAVEQWSLTTLREKLVKSGAKIVRHGRYIVFQMAEVAIPRDLFADILRRIDRLRTTPLPT